MLDDLRYIHNLDKHDMLGLVARQVDQLAFKSGFKPSDFKIKPKQKISSVVVLAMGGSAWSARLVACLVAKDCLVPIEVVRDYTAPAYINESTLVVAVSGSGNTEESIASLKAVQASGCQVAVIAGGGTLVSMAEQNGWPYAVIPQPPEPRLSSLASAVALLQLLNAAGCCAKNDINEKLKASAKVLKVSVAKWRADVPTSQNLAKQLALELVGKTVVVYATNQTAALAERWKMDINENAKNLAFYNVQPEISHNELTGWTSHPLEKIYAVVQINSSYDHERCAMRATVANQLLSGKMPFPELVNLEGATLAEQLIYGVLLGDMASTYLGLLNHQDPLSLPLAEKLKKNLS